MINILYMLYYKYIYIYIYKIHVIRNIYILLVIKYILFAISVSKLRKYISMHFMQQRISKALIYWQLCYIKHVHALQALYLYM